MFGSFGTNSPSSKDMHFHCSLISFKICVACSASSRPAKRCRHWSHQKEKSQAASAMKLTTNPVKSVAKRLAEEWLKWFGMDEQPDNFGNPNSGSIFKFGKSSAKLCMSQDLLKAAHARHCTWECWFGGRCVTFPIWVSSDDEKKHFGELLFYCKFLHLSSTAKMTAPC